MNKQNISIGIILILTVFSCSHSKLTELSINCLCVSTEHYIVSTNDIENSTKKYTFTNSRLFDLGVSEDGFANSFAMQICSQIENYDKFDYIEIDIVKEVNGEVTSTNSFEYELRKVKQELPEYLKLESFISSFVVYIYNKNY